MKKPIPKKNESSIKETPEPRRRKKREKEDKVEEFFGVHVISEADIRNHLGTSEVEPDGETGD